MRPCILHVFVDSSVRPYQFRKPQCFCSLRLYVFCFAHLKQRHTRYPVFPWVLADYTSPSLDLDNPVRGTFRDLSKPIGALNPARLQRFLERRRVFEDPSGETPPFLYGSHYSNVVSARARVVVHLVALAAVLCIAQGRI